MFKEYAKMKLSKYQHIIKIFLCSTTLMVSDPTFARGIISFGINEDAEKDLHPTYRFILRAPHPKGDDVQVPFYGPAYEQVPNYLHKTQDNEQGGLLSQATRFAQSAHKLRVLMENKNKIATEVLRHMVPALSIILGNSSFLKASPLEKALSLSLNLLNRDPSFKSLLEEDENTQPVSQLIAGKVVSYLLDKKSFKQFSERDKLHVFDTLQAETLKILS